jgi:hypothetical protein
MAVEKFNLASLVGIDAGRIKEAFEQAVRRCEDDCRDRPAVDRDRTVTLRASFRPVVGDNGELESCNVDFEINDNIPKRRSKVYNMKAGRHGLLFNELSPEEIRQGTLDEAPGMKAVVDVG